MKLVSDGSVLKYTGFGRVGFFRFSKIRVSGGLGFERYGLGRVSGYTGRVQNEIILPYFTINSEYTVHTHILKYTVISKKSG